MQLSGCMLLSQRTPFWRTFYIVLASVIFFFINLCVIFHYVQSKTSVQHNEPFPEQDGYIPEEIVRPTFLDSCNITEPLAINALARVRTEQCRLKITEAACKLKNNLFHEQFPESVCINHDQLLINLNVGCFADSVKKRTLSGFAYEFKTDNSLEKCRAHCYRAGFIYHGLEFGRECFCGDFINSTLLPSDRCREYKCPGNHSENCGGFNAIVKRLLKAIYSPNHIYYIHVDQRQLFMLTEMKAVAAKLSNVYVSQDIHSTIWGGASLLSMLQDAIRTSLSNPGLYDWDFLINLSESDFPVMTLSELEAQLKINIGKSFLSSHGYNTARFIQKQGFDYVFIECENRMWRIGKRIEFPRNLRIDGGSDWVVLHRDFAEYSVSNEDLPTKMRLLFSTIILPVESFFHTCFVSLLFMQLTINYLFKLLLC
uniref:protein xylosyltransferase n=1 Tax=Heterorhabditis bacteriophora TaxID=37862 RepID=A0A1I7WCM9_HETBA